MFYTVKYCSALEGALSTTLGWLCWSHTSSLSHAVMLPGFYESSILTRPML